jgi:hypothetical protein
MILIIQKMHQIKLNVGAVLLLIFGFTGLHAQESIPASGGNASGSGGSMSYSVGQIVYTTNTGTNGSVAQGIQQPFEISVITGLENTEGISLRYSVYPNPTTDYLVLKVENYDKQNLSYQLIDYNGKSLENKKIISSETIIVLSLFVPAAYFLKVMDDNKEIKIFKIIKN